MEFKNPFKNEEFKSKVDNVLTKLSIYLSENNLESNEIEIKSLVQWHSENNYMKVYVYEFCPNELKGIVTKFIQEEFSEI